MSPPPRFSQYVFSGLTSACRYKNNICYKLIVKVIKYHLIYIKILTYTNRIYLKFSWYSNYHNLAALQDLIVTTLLGLPLWLPTASAALTTSFPSATFPNTTCLPSSQLVSATVRKNWLPFVFLPALAIDKQNGSCLSLKFSSSKLLPQIDRPPVPSPRVKSPPWIIKLGIIRWNLLPS